MSRISSTFTALKSQGRKALILKGARSVNSGKPLDAAPLVHDMANAWGRAMSTQGEAL